MLALTAAPKAKGNVELREVSDPRPLPGVTGASGGVGRFAVQLAKLAGAHVTGVSASAERARGLIELGADETISELEPSGPEFDGIVEGVGGATLAAAIRRVAAAGTIVSFASSDQAPVEFPTREFFGRAPGARLYGLFLFAELHRARSGTHDLGRLAALVAEGRLECSVDLEGSWRDAAEAIAALMDRRISGKAVLRVD
jgi:NADPH:quinone reductase-like Zn-dependent oxidoreductase